MLRNTHPFLGLSWHSALGFILCSLMLFTLSGCNKVSLDIETVESESPTTPTPPTPPPPPSVPTLLVEVSGNGQTGKVNQDLLLPIKVRVLDADGDPMDDITISFSVTSGGGSLADSVVQSDASGEAETIWTLGTSTLPDQKVTVSAPGTNTVIFTATATPDDYAQLIVSGPAGSIGGVCSHAFSIERQDQFGNPTNPATPLTVTATGLGNGNFYTNTNCSSAVTNSPVIPAGAYRTHVYFKDLTAESLSIIFSDGTISTSPHNLLISEAFNMGTPLPIPANPQQLVAADLDRDGNLDVVGTSQNANSVNIYWGLGDGSFSAPDSITVNNGPRGVNVADLNRDGILDIVTLDWGAQTYTVLLGNGDKTFTQLPSVANGGQGLEVNFADLNGDGILDFISHSYNGNQLHIKFGNGDGTFSTNNSYPSCSRPLYSVYHDFDQDGDIDIVLSCISANEVNYYENDGNGSFGSPVSYTTGASPGFMNIGDYNQDGKMDLLVSNESSGSVSYFEGNGDGTFKVKVDTSGLGQALSIRTADFNNDGRLDFSVVTRTPNSVWVIYGNGDGTFSNPVQYPHGAQGSGLAIGDFNHDGAIDMVSASRTDTSIHVFLGVPVNQSGMLNNQTRLATVSDPKNIITADLDSDSNLDLAVVSSSGMNNLGIQKGNGDGTFSAPVNYPLGVLSSLPDSKISIKAADLNRDGKLDLAVAFAETNQVSVVFGDGNGAFSTSTLYTTGNNPSDLAIEDINGDGSLDLIITAQGSAEVDVFLNDGSGNFLPRSSYATFADPASLAIADINYDGQLDVIATSINGQASILLGAGSGTLNPAAHFASLSEAQGAKILDLNHDGKLDLFMSHSTEQSFSYHLGDGTGSIDAGTAIAADDDISDYLFYDWTHDGHIDFITSLGNKVQVFANDGALGFTIIQEQTLSSPPTRGVKGDFNRDGLIDVIFLLPEEDSLSIHLSKP